MANAKFKSFIEHPQVNYIILAVIILNSIILGMETSPTINSRFGSMLQLVDFSFTIFFIAEITIKIIAYGKDFFRSSWNLFDFFIIVFTALPFWGNISILRAFRILRALRIMSLVPKLQLVIRGFFDSLWGLLSVATVLILLLYVSAVLATILYGKSFPQFFGSFSQSLFSMFQITTLEGWPDIVRNIMKVDPYAWLFFIPFIIITTFSVFNLLIGIIVNSMQKVHEEDQDQTLAEIREITQEEQMQLVSEFRNLSDKLEEIKKILVK